MQPNQVTLPALILALVVSQCGIKPHPLYRSTPEYQDKTKAPVPEKEKNIQLDQPRMMQIINSYLNSPYKYGGTTKAGMDCSGLVIAVYKESTGMDLPHSSQKMFGLGKLVPKRKLKFGDLVFFGKSISAIDHVGIYTGNGQFAHASTQKGVIISKLKEKYYRRRYRGAVRIIK